VTVLPAMSTSQYAEQKKPSGHVAVLTGMLLVFLTAAVLLCGRYALVLIAVLAGYGLTLRRGYRSLGGMNGDIAGAALTMGELFAAGALMLF
jgi:cobalamin synthase